MSNIPTPHIAAKEGDFAKTVLMPGDPLRAKFIAETFLTDAVLVNNVRGVNGYTGYYNGKRVSVMASGMGIPSMGIYSYELFNFYTDSNYGAQYELPGTFAPIASFELLRKAVKVIEEMGNIGYKVGNVVSSDVFYSDRQTTAAWQKMGALAIEMESAALYMNAARAGKNALTICTISDSLVTGEVTTAEERQTSFDDMMKIALEIA